MGRPDHDELGDGRTLDPLRPHPASPWQQQVRLAIATPTD
jgi:hypothetical protein